MKKLLLSFAIATILMSGLLSSCTEEEISVKNNDGTLEPVGTGGGFNP